MKKVLIFSVALAAFSGVASAATACGTTNYVLTAGNTITPIGGGTALTSCEAGDKIFSNFSGNMDTTNANLTVTFNGSGLGPYNVQVSDATNAALTEPSFTLNYTVTVDETGVTGGFNYISFIGAGGIDSFNAIASNANIISGAGAGCTPLTSVDTGSGGFHTVTCGTTGQPQSVGIAETYTYSGGTPTATSIQDSYFQSFQATSGTPEPMSMFLFGTGFVAIALLGRKRLARK
jgi:hypothetical protein